jgi:hypothetical protein
MDASDLIKALQNTLQGRGRPHMENQFGLRSAPIGFLRIASTAREISFHIGRESCAGVREAVREALTGERAGQPLSRENSDGRAT